MLSAELEAALRAEQEAAMPDTCVVSRPTETIDELGGLSQSYATVATVACRVAAGPFRDVEFVRNEQVRGITDWIVTLPAGTDAENSDRIVHGGDAYEVVSVLSGGSYETARRLGCVKVD